MPTHLKVVRGNPGKRPLNDREPVPERVLPDPPPELSEDGLAEWTRVVGELHRTGILSEIDRGALAAYCQAYGRWAQAERAIAKMAEKDPLTSGMMIRTTNGNAIQNPLVGIANKAMSDLVRYAAEFGMTPSARSRIHAQGSEPEKPEGFAQFG